MARLHPRSILEKRWENLSPLFLFEGGRGGGGGRWISTLSYKPWQFAGKPEDGTRKATRSLCI